MEIGRNAGILLLTHTTLNNENRKLNMTALRVQEDEPESDDHGQNHNTPLTQKPILMIKSIDSETTLLTSPSSSRKSSNYDSTLVFDDNIKIIEVDCDYTDEQVAELWFTKTEYDDFLKACDEDAQKYEAHVKQLRVAKLKKEIRKQRRQRRREEKRRQSLDHTSNGLAPEDDVMDVDMDVDMDDDVTDDSVTSESSQRSNGEINKKDDEGSLCSLGLEAWTLEGYQTREHNRQKAMDAVLNEQYAAWDRGVIENMEMMSALYFAASATSKHAAMKRGKEVEEDVKQLMVVSTLEDYNRAVHTLNVLQKSLYCIKSKNDKIKPKMNRRGSNENTKMNRRGSNENPKMNRRGSNESAKANRRGSIERGKLNRRGSNESCSSVDRTMAVTDAAKDIAPRPPTNVLSDGEYALKSGTSESKPPTSSTMSRKKIKPRGSKVSGTPHKIYKSKQSMDILVAPPTPPQVKAGKVTYNPEGPKPDILEPPISTKTSPKSRKITYRPPAAVSPKTEDPLKSDSRNKSTKTTKSPEPMIKAKKHFKQQQTNRPEETRSKSPGRIKKSRRRSMSPSNTGEYKDRSKSPKRVGEGKARDRSRSPKKTREGRSRRKSPGRMLDKIRGKSPLPSAKKLLKKMNPTQSKAKHAPSVASVSSTENVSSLSTHNSKKEHWWFSQPRQEVQ